MSTQARARELLVDVLALHSTAQLSFVLKAVALELGVRMHCDARNYTLRAVACLDADLAKLAADHATEERPPSA